MTMRHPRAPTSDGLRSWPRATSQTDRTELADRLRANQLRAPTIDPTDRVERISETSENVSEHDVIEEAELAPEPPWEPAAAARDLPLERYAPRLRLLVLEGVPHLASAQTAIVASGHVVVVGATGAGGADRLRAVIGDVDAMLVGLPGGEPLIEAALAMGPRRPIVIAAWSSSAVEAARHAAALGADLATVRPHDIERLAPILLAAGRLVEQRRLPGAVEISDAIDVSRIDGGDDDSDGDGDLDGLDPDLADTGTALPAVRDGAGALVATPVLHDPLARPDVGDVGEPGGFVAFEVFQQVAAGALQRAERYAYPLVVAMFSVEVAEPPPLPGLRGILRARAGNALVHAVRDIDVATELDHDRFLVLMPYTERLAGADVARRIIGAVAAGDPVVIGGRAFPPKVIGAVSGARRGEPLDLAQLIAEVTQLLEQAQATGASLAVAP